MTPFRFPALASVLALFGYGTPTLACSSETPYEVENGEYVIVMPEGVEGPVPVVVFLHGGGGSGPGVLRNTGLVKGVTERGYALIAPSGKIRPGRRGGCSIPCVRLYAMRSRFLPRSCRMPRKSTGSTPNAHCCRAFRSVGQ